MEDLLHKGKNVMFFDLETAGFPKKDEPIGIIELGLQYVPELGFSKDVTTISQLYSVKETIPFEITKITGINNTMLQDKPNIMEHFDTIQDIVNESEIIVAHNAPFDIRCLELIGISFKGKEVFDTKTHSKRMFPELISHKMGDVCSYLGVENNAAHRAIFDVNAMIQIYAQMTNFNLHEEKLEALLKKHKKLTYTKK